MIDGGVSLESRFRSHTETYLDTIVECIHLLPRLFEEYAHGNDYRATAQEIRALESDCDESKRRISSLLSNATVEQIGLRNTRIHLNSPEILELYQQLDEVANVAEEIAEELVTIRPPRIEPHFGAFLELAWRATTAVTVLEAVVTTITRLLCSHDRSETLADEIRTIRRIESECDELRNDLIEGAFRDDAVDRPLLYREFARHFDRLVDTMEDVTDQVVLISSREDWIDAESPVDG